MLKLRHDRRRRRWLAASVLAVAVGLAVSDVAVDSVRVFWVGHAMFTALVAFGATLALTVLVVEEQLRARAQQRWGFIGDIAIRKLSGQAFLVCTGLLNLISDRNDQDERLADAYSQFATTGQRPGFEDASLLPEGFEEQLHEILAEPEGRRELFEACIALTDILDTAAVQWAPVMLRADNLADAMNVFGMMHKTLSWFTSALDDYEESSQRRLDAWSNLRVFLVMYALFDSCRREITNEPAMFGVTADDHDLVWGLPFEVIRRRTAHRPSDAVATPDAVGRRPSTQATQDEATARAQASP